MRKTIFTILGSITLAAGIFSGMHAAKANSSPGTLPLLNAQHWTITVDHPPQIGGSIFLYYNYGNINQDWVFVGPHSNGTYSIQSYDNTSLCIDDYRTYYTLSTCNNTSTEEWFVGAYGNGYQIENSYYADCISDDGYVLANRNPIIPWTCEYPPPGWQLWA